ncbi:hypothetical protein TSMEX_008358 [Taenia solium]|eukprot:TsM_001176400 transcript=TsM_001176400 gene=TsM_001176400
MRSHPSLLCLLLAFASYHVYPAVVPDGEAAEQSEAGLFGVPNLPEDEKMAEAKDFDWEKEEEEEELIKEAFDVGRQKDVLLPAGWRRLRFRRPQKIPIPTCPNGGRSPGPMTP